VTSRVPHQENLGNTLAQNLKTYLPAEMQSLSRRSRGAVGSLNVTGEDTSLSPATSVEQRRLVCSLLDWVLGYLTAGVTQC